MTNSTDPSERLATDVCTNLKTLFNSLPFRKPMCAERQSRDFVIPVFVSVFIHAFLAYLLWAVISDRSAVEPAAPATDKPLIVSLSRYTDSPQDRMDREAAPAVPPTPAQRSQPSTEPSKPSPELSQPSPEPDRSAEPRSEAEAVAASKSPDVPGSEAPEVKPPAANAAASIEPDNEDSTAWEFLRISEFEAEAVVTSKDRRIQSLETPGGKSPAIYANPSFELDTDYRMAWEFASIPEFKAGTFVISKGRWIPDSESPENNSLEAYSTPFLEAAYLIEREFSRTPEYQVQAQLRRIKVRMLYMKKFKVEYNASFQDCRTVFAGNGLFAIPLLIKDAITGNGCKWKSKIE